MNLSFFYYIFTPSWNDQNIHYPIKTQNPLSFHTQPHLVLLSPISLSTSSSTLGNLSSLTFLHFLLQGNSSLLTYLYFLIFLSPKTSLQGLEMYGLSGPNRWHMFGCIIPNIMHMFRPIVPNICHLFGPLRLNNDFWPECPNTILLFGHSGCPNTCNMFGHSDAEQSLDFWVKNPCDDG